MRFIPTPVGKTSATVFTAIVLLGSSPRLWGKPRGHARAALFYPVHPHACGENGTINVIFS